MEQIFDPSRHESLVDVPWNEAAASYAIASIVNDAVEAWLKQGIWTAHQEDKDGDTAAFYDLYLGAAGAVWALDTLKRNGATDRSLPPDLDLSDWITPNRLCFPGEIRIDSLLSGDAGLLLTQYRRKPDPSTANALAHAVEVNLDHPSMELMWGGAGSMLASLEMHGATGEDRWLGLYRRGAAILQAALERYEGGTCRAWTQALWKRRQRMLGLVHGFAGNALAMIRGRKHLDPKKWSSVSADLARTLAATAVYGDDGVNWPSHIGTREPGRKMLMQICHGAPGMVVGLAALDRPIDELLIAAGETIWRAGPLAKGSNLCHGTSGNGYAFLKLFARTRDEVWLARARAFAMHAISQNAAERERFGMRRYSLWTGDLGLALYINACISGSDEFPTLEV